MTNSLKLEQYSLQVETLGKKSLFKITPQVQEIIIKSSIQTGLCTLFVRHTSASLLIQENDALPDVESFFAQANYREKSSFLES